MLRRFSFAVALAAAVMFSPAAIAGKGHGGHGHGGHGGHGHGGHGMAVMGMAVMGMAVMGMAATDMATVMRTGIIIIGTTAIDTVTVVIGAVVGTDMEWAPAGDGRRVATFGFATKHTNFEEGRGLRSAPFSFSLCQ